MITGYLLSDRYQVGDVVGQGGMSVVLHGRDMRLDRDVAIKVLRADLVADDKYEARFRHEASNAASLNHPAIVGVYDTGETDDEDGAVPFIVMEYVNGETLREALAREGEFSTRRALEIAADICAALDFSHRHGIVHRNISPKNVMLDTTGAVKVMDFGVARPLAAGAGSTSTSAMVETAEYLSPEQARGEPVDARSDVYSVGCVLDEMLTGKPPFTAHSAVEVADQHVHRAPTAPSEIDPGISPDIDSIVLTALAKSPLNRYQTAAQMRTELSRALAAHRIRTAARSETADQPGSAVARLPSGGSGSPPLLAPPVTVTSDVDWEPEPRSRSKRVWGFVGIAGLCAAVLAGAIWLTLQVVTAGPPKAPVAVPDLSGKSLEEATAILQEKQLTLGSVAPVDSDDASTGKVVAQRPSSQTQVGQDTAVNVEIGKGVTLVAVPDLVGSTSDAAKKAVADARLNYVEQLQPSSDADKGRVLTQDAAPRADLAPGSTVTVTIGTGQNLVTVPGDVIGKNIDEATQILQQARLTVVAQDADGTEPVNQVIGMDQQSGKQVPEGTPVTLSYSNNTLMTMPGVQGQSPDQAVATLQSVGWAGDLSSLLQTPQAAPNGSSIGSVVNQ
ncbi:MAG TPA: Stk1 family PASTA domain-containing Ser/Thr kinase, partial [Nakamurella sp.]